MQKSNLRLEVGEINRSDDINSRDWSRASKKGFYNANPYYEGQSKMLGFGQKIATLNLSYSIFNRFI